MKKPSEWIENSNSKSVRIAKVSHGLWKLIWRQEPFFFLFMLMFMVLMNWVWPVTLDENGLLFVRSLITDHQTGEPVRGVVKLFSEWTTLGGYPVLILLLGVATSGFAGLRLYRQAFYLLTTFAAAALFIECAKHFLRRARPDVVTHLVDVSSYSFPSSHSGLSAVLYLSLAIAIGSQCASQLGRRTLILLAFLLMLIVGLSRIVLGVHYPLDVLAGWTIGASLTLRFQSLFGLDKSSTETAVSPSSVDG